MRILEENKLQAEIGKIKPQLSMVRIEKEKRPRLGYWK